MMKRFRKTKSTAGFDKVNVDKMFAISGGSLTAWGRSVIGNRYYGHYRTESTQVFTGYEQQNVYQQSNGRYRMINVAQYRTSTVKYWYFNDPNRAGCTRTRV